MVFFSYDGHGRDNWPNLDVVWGWVNGGLCLVGFLNIKSVRGHAWTREEGGHGALILKQHQELGWYLEHTSNPSTEEAEAREL